MYVQKRIVTYYIKFGSCFIFINRLVNLLFSDAGLRRQEQTDRKSESIDHETYSSHGISDQQYVSRSCSH